MFDDRALSLVKTEARKHGVDWRMLAAIIEVESGGKAGTVIGGRLRPMIRFEGHYFWRRLKGEARLQAWKERLASEKAGVVKNPRLQADRYRMFERAAQISRRAAIESTSWGVGQVMGAHWQALGYPTPYALMLRAMDGVDGQVEIMMGFLEVNNLFVKLARGDLNGFFKAYNGPAYERQGYPKMYARAWAVWGKLPRGTLLRQAQDEVLDEALRQAQDEALRQAPLRQAQDEAAPAFDADLPDWDTPPAPDFLVEGVLRENGSRTIRHADAVQSNSSLGMISGILAGGGPLAALPYLGNLHPAAQIALIAGAIAAAIAVFILWRNRGAARAIRAARVDDARNGVNASRLGVLADLVRR